MLLAAATETKLITQLCEALPTKSATARPPLVGSSAVLHQRLLLTLLFLGIVGLQRTWDLRDYTADGLALLTGRGRMDTATRKPFCRRWPIPRRRSA